MKFLKKINDCFVALALTTFVCIGPTVMPAFATALEDPDQTEEPLVSTENPGEIAPTAAAEGNDVATEAALDDEAAADASDDEVAAEALPQQEGASDEAQVKAVDDEAVADEPTAEDESSSAEETAAVISAASETESNVFDVATADELKDAFQKIDAGAAGTYAVNLTADIAVDDSLNVASGKTVDMTGNGHTLSLDGGATLDVNRGTLNLNGGLTIAATGARSNALVSVTGGTLNMRDGVTLTGNNINADGGGVYLYNKAKFNMNGGTIENCGAHQGGGVYLDKNSTFTMSGDATIRNNRAANVGGGVYVGSRSTFTMEGNASVVSNEGDAAGGVMNYGLATLTTVYNNTTHNGAADIFNLGRMKLSPTNPDWVLSSTGTHVTGWYTDDYGNYSRADDDSIDDIHRWDPNDEDSVEYVPSAGETRESLQLIAGAPLPRVNVIWENEDGTVLFTMSDVKENEIPAADEYTELSGNANPTEPDSDGLKYTFDNWSESEDDDGNVIYTAEYDAVPQDAPSATDDQIDIADPDVPSDDPADTPSTPSDPDVVPSDDPADTPSTHDDSSTQPNESTPSDNVDVTDTDNGNKDVPESTGTQKAVMQEDGPQEPVAQDDAPDDESDADASQPAKTNDAGAAQELAAFGGMAAGLAGLAYINQRRKKEDC